MRKSRSSQPYWIVSTATDGASPATASPTPSAADLEDTEDPSFSAELPAVKAGGKSKARPEAMDKGQYFAMHHNNVQTYLKPVADSMPSIIA